MYGNIIFYATRLQSSFLTHSSSATQHKSDNDLSDEGKVESDIVIRMRLFNNPHNPLKTHYG